MQNKNEKINKLAKELLALSRNTLLINLRFLDVALSRLTYIPIDLPAIMTDGQHLFYNPIYVLQSYKRQKELPTRNYLHIVMHCIFRHMYFSASVNRTYWDLACDIAVENSINELHLNTVETANVSRQAAVIEDLRRELPRLTAETIYRYFRKRQLSENEANKLRSIFAADSHGIWYLTDENPPSTPSPNGTPSAPPGGRDSMSAMQGKAFEQAAEDWKSIARHVQTDLETFNKARGTQAGGMLQNLKEVTREKYNYTEFLKKFMITGEAMQINDEEFDYIFYTHGMRLYKNMPLIEPLEYKEVKRIRDLAIVIDTSGSVSGELVQSFLQKTYNILKSEETFFKKFNLHIIQCDAQIQEDAKITSQEEFDVYISTMCIHGLGGTDFRPAFEYVEQLRKNKEFINLRGLIYFTDGYGTFPAKKPDYQTAVVFIDSGQNSFTVPPWAIKVILKKEEI